MSEAKAFAQEIGALYRKTSAKTNFGIDQLFREISGKIDPGLKQTIPVLMPSAASSQQTGPQGVKLGEGKGAKKPGKCC